MRVPADLPPRLPPRIETPVPLAEAIVQDAAEWEAATDALDTLSPPTAEDSEDLPDQEQDEDAHRQPPQALDPEEDEDMPAGGNGAARRPDLATGFWVLPEPHHLLRYVPAPGRGPLLTAVAAPLGADVAGHRAARRGMVDRDEDHYRDQPTGSDEHASDE